MAPHHALDHPWDSPGKNTGVGCHFLRQCMKVKSESVVTQSCPILSDPMDCGPPGSSVHGIFQARTLEWGAIAFSVPLSRWRIMVREHWYSWLVFKPILENYCLLYCILENYCLKYSNLLSSLCHNKIIPLERAPAHQEMQWNLTPSRNFKSGSHFL